jgi:hypothetical protein
MRNGLVRRSSLVVRGATVTALIVSALALASCRRGAGDACRCGAEVEERLLREPGKAKTRMLMLPRPGTADMVEADVRAWSAAVPSRWMRRPGACELRYAPDTWHLLLSESDGSDGFDRCNAWAQPVEAFHPDILARVGAAWEADGAAPNPAWGVGCKADAECAVSAASGCLPELAVLASRADEASAWRKRTEPRLDCVSASPAPGSTPRAAACKTGVCVFR